MNQDPKIIVAMDVPSMGEAFSMATRLNPALCRVKVGMELFTAAGPAIVDRLMHQGFEVFLDLKFHDIPNTVAGAIRSAANMGVWMVNIHALGGRKMMEAAVSAASGSSTAKRPILIGVTILTSMEQADMEEVGIECMQIAGRTRPMERLAELALKCGLDGIVCSGQEVRAVRMATNQSFVLVTPGIRLPDGNSDDQARIVTPEIAIANGANYLVVGRPIMSAPDPIAALHVFNERIASAVTQ